MLVLDGVSKSFGDNQALDGVSLRVDHGEIVGFVGANGAGKSTTMRIAMGLLAADEGAISFDGQPIDRSVRRRFGYLPEERGLYPKMRIADQISYLGQLYGQSAAEANRRAGELLAGLQVKAELTDQLQALSLGNQQRVQLAAALVHDPVLLVMDEPFSGLDPVAVDLTAEVLFERRRAGVGVLFSSHQLELVEQYCDRIVIVRGGHIVATGTLDELRAAAGPPELEIVLDAAAEGWWIGIAPEPPRGDGRGEYVFTLPDKTSGLDQRLLAAAIQAGPVRSFGWRSPSLGELYREAVAA